MYGGTHFADAIEEVGIEVQNITNSANLILNLVAEYLLNLIQCWFQGIRLGNEIAKIVVEFMKNHINPDPAAASLPLSALIQSN